MNYWFRSISHEFTLLFTPCSQFIHETPPRPNIASTSTFCVVVVVVVRFAFVIIAVLTVTGVGDSADQATEIKSVGRSVGRSVDRSVGRSIPS